MTLPSPASWAARRLGCSAALFERRGRRQQQNNQPVQRLRPQSSLGQIQRSRSRSTPTSSFTMTRSARRSILGNVVVVQGDTKIDLLGHDRPSGSRPDARSVRTDKRPARPRHRLLGVKHLDATGPVTVVSKTQVATGDRGSYDKAEDKVWLIGLRHAQRWAERNQGRQTHL